MTSTHSWSLFAWGREQGCPVEGEWSVAHRRGLRRKGEHKQRYGALGGGIPHLWGKKLERASITDLSMHRSGRRADPSEGDEE